MFATGLLVATVVFGLWLGGMVVDAMRSSSWPHVEGTVVHSKLVRYGKGTTLQLLYHYRVAGTSYDGDRVTFAGNSPMFCDAYSEIASNYSENSRVRIYYNPSNPVSSALQPGLPTVLGFLILPLLLVGACVALFAWSTYDAAFGPTRTIPNPDVEDPRSVSQRALIAMIGAVIMLVAGGIAVMMLRLASTAPRSERDALMGAAALFVGVVLAAFMCLLAWFGWLLFMSAFKRPETINDVRCVPGTPQFSDSSLVCFSAGLGSSIAVIADHDKGMIHFKKCFQRRQRGFFSGLSVPWWSCPLSDITGLSQMTYKGHTTFIIETQQGKASISTRINNYAELRHYLQNRPLEQTQHAASSKAKVELSEKLHNSVSLPVQSEYVPEQVTIVARKPDAHRAPRPMPVKKEYAFGDKPLDWRVGMCVAGLFFGPIAGFLFGMTYDRKNVGMHSALGIVLGGCSGLPFFYVTPRRLGRFVASKNGMPVAGGAVGLLVFLLLKFFFHLEFIDLLVLVGAGTVLGFLFASQRAK